MFKIKNVFELVLVIAIFILILTVWTISGVTIGSPAWIETLIFTGLVAGFFYGIDKQTYYKKWKFWFSPRLVFILLITIPLLSIDVIDFINTPAVPYIPRNDNVVIEQTGNDLFPMGQSTTAFQWFPHSSIFIVATILTFYFDKKKRIKNFNKDKLFV